MDKHFITIVYKLADGKRIRLEVTSEVAELVAQSDRQIRSQRRQDRRYLIYTDCIEELDGTTMTDPPEDAADLLIRMDSYKQLYTAMGKLSETHRRRIYLYYYCGLSCREIARIENVHHTTVSRSLKQALKAMEAQITE